MVNGNLTITPAPYYEDYPSLKKWVRKQTLKYKTMRLSRFMYEQVGTAGFVDISEKGGETIADIGAEGAVYAICEVDDASTQNKETTLEYLDDAGEIHFGYAVFGADSSVEAQFFTTSGGAVAVADFYRIRDLCFENVIAGGYLAIGPTGFASNYGVIEVGNHCSIISKYYCPKDRTAWLAQVNWSSSVATKVVTQMDITFYPYGETDSHVAIINNDGHIQIDPLFKLAVNYPVSFRVKGLNVDNTFNIHIIEVENV